MAGYCWNWVSKKNPGLNDIVITEHGYSARWNLDAEKNMWIISPTGVEEVGCVHTCQGLEVDTIGVMTSGPDRRELIRGALAAKATQPVPDRSGQPLP